MSKGSSSSGTDDFDWVFDVAMQILESEVLDFSVMDFVDSHCEAFDSLEEENRLEFTTVHRAFVELIEALITAECAEMGITPELFYEACKASRRTRDVNTAVFERLTAIDDFPTFKKLMVKRNVELQLEALRSFKTSSSSEGQELWRSIGDHEHPSSVLLSDAYLEMELLHKQEMLEQSDLDLAVALSLAMEEEAGASAGSKHEHDDEYEGARRSSFLAHAQAESKGDFASSTRSAGAEAEAAIGDTRRKNSYSAHAALENASEEHVRAAAYTETDSKSLMRGKGDKSHTVLSPLKQPQRPVMPVTAPTLMRAEDLLVRSKRDAESSRDMTADLRKQLDEDEIDRRAAHMRKQQRAIVEKKMKEREARLKTLGRAEEKGGVPTRVSVDAKGAAESKGDAAGERRAAMSMALAGRLKEELGGSGVTEQMVENQLSDLNKKLKQVEASRQRNEQRERALAAYLNRHNS